MATLGRRSVRTSVLLSEQQYERLTRIATASDVSVAWVIRQAVQKFLDSTGSEPMPLPIRLGRTGHEDD
jgi:predicted DNA-binding ribbon-helix-helix protein